MSIRNVFIKHHPHSAGKWIYKGYESAWRHLGYEVHSYTDLAEINNFKEKYYVMATDGAIRTPSDTLRHAERAFIFAQPETFPLPWGSHPNFISGCPSFAVDEINEMKNCVLWSWSDNHDYYTQWKPINTVELAFDSLSYQDMRRQDIYDMCYIGGWANNGFDEKRKIMLEYFKEFKESGLNCGIFINKNISHDQENFILSNSKVCINIHDAHHHTTGFDTNERTFKTLGVNGCLVCDSIGRGKETNQIKRLFPHLPVADTPLEMVEKVRIELSRPAEEAAKIKEDNRKNILENHTYIERVKEMLRL